MSRWQHEEEGAKQQETELDALKVAACASAPQSSVDCEIKDEQPHSWFKRHGECGCFCLISLCSDMRCASARLRQSMKKSESVEWEEARAAVSA